MGTRKRNYPSADLMKELLDLSASPISSCSPTAGGSGSPVAGSDASMMEYSFEEEELKEADITGAESIALYRKIQEKILIKYNKLYSVYTDHTHDFTTKSRLTLVLTTRMCDL